MALAVWQGVVVDTDGAIIPNAEVAVVVEATGLDADLFTDVDGTTPTANPVFSDSEGFVRFYVAPGTYRITFTGVSGNRILRHVSIAGLDADDQRWTGTNLWPANAITLTGSATLSPGESTIILNAASGTATVPDTFPVGTKIKFRKIHASAGDWDITMSGTDTIDGGASITIKAQYQEVEIEQVADGVWRSSQISGLPTASLPLDGSEMVTIDKDGSQLKTPLNQGIQEMTGSEAVTLGCRLILLNAASGTATVPTTIPVGQDVEFIKIHASAGTWTGARSGSDTFGGATSFTISDQYERQVWTKVSSTRWERKLWSLGAQEYEEGTWDPELRSTSGEFGPITYSAARYGIYRRVGDEWRVWVLMQTDSIDVGTASGQVRITLPSVSTNLGGSQGISISYSTSFGGDTPTSALILGGSGFINLYFRSTPNGGVTDLDVTDLATGASSNSIRIVGAYIGA